MRTFEIDFGQDTAIIELDDAVIEVVNDEWRSMFYELNTPEEIVKHIARNMILNGLNLSDLDGWANQPDTNAKIIKWPEIYPITVREL